MKELKNFLSYWPFRGTTEGVATRKQFSIPIAAFLGLYFALCFIIGLVYGIIAAHNGTPINNNLLDSIINILLFTMCISFLVPLWTIQIQRINDIFGKQIIKGAKGVGLLILFFFICNLINAWLSTVALALLVILPSNIFLKKENKS